MAQAVTTWEEPGGEQDPADPRLAVPASAAVLLEGEGVRPEGVSDSEIEWMVQQRPLTLCERQLRRDYGDSEAQEMLQATDAAGMPRDVAGVLAWPGVGTRWRRFLLWWSLLPEADRPRDARGALAGFAGALGRVRTYRALALDDHGLRRILDEDEIFPSGRLKPGVDAAHLQRVIEEHGVAKVAVIRLFISHMPKIGGVDPSISLHDDWQTTSVIASGYATDGKRVHLFELSVPAIESLGWTLLEVAHRAGPFLGPRYADHKRWFCFQSPAAPKGTWFDASLQRTERYGLYSVPHLRHRLRRLYAFPSVAELGRAVAPFVTEMARRQQAEPDLDDGTG